MIAFHYRVFHEVATNLSFSKAAQNLYISQPAVSKNIKKLEIEIGIALFERRGAKIVLTESGEKLLSYLREAMSIEKQVDADLEIFKTELNTRGELKIGASTTISLYVLPKILSAFRQKYPLVKILLVNRNSENILKALGNYEIDVAVIEGHQVLNTLEYQPFITDDIIGVCSKKSPWNSKVIGLSDFVKAPLVMRERGSGTQAVVVKSLEAKGVRMADLNVIAKLGGTEAMKNFLLEETAIGFLSSRAVEKELKSGELRQVQIKDLEISRPFTFAIRKGEQTSGFIKDFIKEARRHYN